MSEVEILEGVHKIILAHSPERSKITSVDGNMSILQDLKVNSARLVDIILELEDWFNISISDNDADGIRTVGDAANLVARLI
jgi:acyl carrier protein